MYTCVIIASAVEFECPRVKVTNYLETVSNVYSAPLFNGDVMFKYCSQFIKFQSSSILTIAVNLRQIFIKFSLNIEILTGFAHKI